jgi:biopolymer transport protein ExbB
MIGRLLMKCAAMLGVVMFLAITVGAGDASAWWDDKWEARRKLAFDTSDKGAAVKENLDDVAVLVRLHAGNFDFDRSAEDGSDVRFVGGDDKTPLKFHMEKFDQAQGIGLFWVRVPQVAGASGQNSVWVYYGNGGVKSGADTGGTYDTPQALVLHFSEQEGTPRDATAYGNHAVEFKGTLGTAAAIGNGASFNGSTDRIVIKRAPSLDFSKGFTFSAWVKPGQLAGEARLFSWDDGKGSIRVSADLQGVSAGINGATTGRAPLKAQEWQHVVVTAEPGKKLTVYVNGKAAVSTPAPASIPSPAAELAIAATVDGKAWYAGELDEVQLAAVARPEAWIAAQFAAEGQDGKLTSLSEEEEGKGGEDLTIHLMKVIARSITLDGWVIIGFCTIMLLMCTYVFIKKFLLLQTVQQENEAFLEAFGQLEDPLALTSNDDYSESSLYRIYMAGHEEISRWRNRSGSKGETPHFSQSILNIYRAALDKASVKEGQRMSAWLIVMTLGISGGPFWGLLGTVWGVMNTFASLAEAGEANLSAIAPGVASALACTLFGLLVAIPALFAYSYLTNRMKLINADTRSFIDELHVKIEGTYGETA